MRPQIFIVNCPALKSVSETPIGVFVAWQTYATICGDDSCQILTGAVYLISLKVDFNRKDRRLEVLVLLRVSMGKSKFDLGLFSTDFTQFMS